MGRPPFLPERLGPCELFDSGLCSHFVTNHVQGCARGVTSDVACIKRSAVGEEQHQLQVQHQPFQPTTSKMMKITLSIAVSFELNESHSIPISQFPHP